MNEIKINELMLELKEQTKGQIGIHRLILDLVILLRRIDEKLEVKE